MRNRTSDLSETETLYGGQSLLRSSYMTRVLYTARISRDLMVGKAHYEVHRILLLVSRLPQRRKPMDPALILFIVCGLREQLPLKLLTDTTLHTL